MSHLTAIRCRHMRTTHRLFRLRLPSQPAFDGQLVFVCAACVDLLGPLLTPVGDRTGPATGGVDDRPAGCIPAARLDARSAVA
jgi:hypothetical protein